METQTEVRFSEEKLQKVQEIIKRYPQGKQKSALLPVLHLAQEEFGWLPVEVMDYVASLLTIKPIEVYEVASFYTMYHLRPVGKIVMEFCHTGPCALRGAEKIQKYIEQKLNIKAGETTEDGIFTLKTVECLASCGSGPMMQMGDYYYENLDEAKVDQLLAEWRSQSEGMKVHFRGKHL
ncbi:MAG: NAD(P)H-dependent oxidoreductase subunit E [Sphingobacteriales bacterium]|nr:MAG: NAD(P)H-dependent oxidoreductase subunit E [Sphingobacteriales bacterium]